MNDNDGTVGSEVSVEAQVGISSREENRRLTTRYITTFRLSSLSSQVLVLRLICITIRVASNLYIFINI